MSRLHPPEELSPSPPVIKHPPRRSPRIHADISKGKAQVNSGNHEYEHKIDLGENLMYQNNEQNSGGGGLYEQGSGEQITNKLSSSEEIITEQKSRKGITIMKQVNNVKQNIDKQQTSCLKVNHHIDKDMLRKQSNVSFSKELETKDKPLRKNSKLQRTNCGA